VDQILWFAGHISHYYCFQPISPFMNYFFFYLNFFFCSVLVMSVVYLVRTKVQSRKDRKLRSICLRLDFLMCCIDNAYFEVHTSYNPCFLFELACNSYLYYRVGSCITLSNRASVKLYSTMIFSHRGSIPVSLHSYFFLIWSRLVLFCAIYVTCIFFICFCKFYHQHSLSKPVCGFPYVKDPQLNGFLEK
jgi:hypothetical protein